LKLEALLKMNESLMTIFFIFLLIPQKILTVFIKYVHFKIILDMFEIGFIHKHGQKR